MWAVALAFPGGSVVAAVVVGGAPRLAIGTKLATWQALLALLAAREFWLIEPGHFAAAAAEGE